MSQAKATTQKQSSTFPWALVVIVSAFAVALVLYLFVFGNPKNFIDPETRHQPLPGNYLGIVYAGGFIVPILITMLLTVFTFGIERFLTINKAKGSGSLEKFLQVVKTKLHNGDINGALAECQKQKGSVANVVQAGLHKYQEMEKNNEFTLEQKVQNIQQEVEEATSLELPSLQQNLPILATIASIATLFALLGTVIGMIKAFAALATTGNPDPAALAAGISEALINTAIGIGTSAFSIMFYNYFTTMIDGLTYGIDEIGYSIAQTFAATKK